VELAGPELLPPVEHHVLEEVRDAGLAAALVARARAVEDVRGDDGGGLILVEQHAEPVRQRFRYHRQLDREAAARKGEEHKEAPDAAPHEPALIADDGGSSSC